MLLPLMQRASSVSHPIRDYLTIADSSCRTVMLAVSAASLPSSTHAHLRGRASGELDTFAGIRPLTTDAFP